MMKDYSHVIRLRFYLKPKNFRVQGNSNIESSNKYKVIKCTFYNLSMENYMSRFNLQFILIA